MKVKVSELKTHFSRYLKDLEEEGPIEVCLREEPVAYLTAASTKTPQEEDDLADKLASVGLVLRQAPGRRPRLQIPDPVPAGDGRTDIKTVELIRSARDY